MSMVERNKIIIIKKKAEGAAIGKKEHKKSIRGKSNNIPAPAVFR